MRKHNLAFVDLETTGFSPERNEIIEIGAVMARQVPQAGRGPKLEVVEEFDLKIKPEHLETADGEALRINGYNEAEWLFALDLPAALKIFAEKTVGATLVAHNLVFEWQFLEAAFKKSGVKNLMHYGKIDTISFALAKLFHDENVRGFSLPLLADYFGLDAGKAHTALADARTTFALYQKLIEL